MSVRSVSSLADLESAHVERKAALTFEALRRAIPGVRWSTSVVNLGRGSRGVIYGVMPDGPMGPRVVVDASTLIPLACQRAYDAVESWVGDRAIQAEAAE